MDTREGVSSPRQPKKFYRHLQAAALSLLIGGGMTRLDWQGIHIPRPHSAKKRYSSFSSAACNICGYRARGSVNKRFRNASTRC